MQQRTSLNQYIQDSITSNWELLALTDFDGISLQFKGVAQEIAKLHILFEHAGIEKGDRIALCGRNSSCWAVAFLATLAYGAVAVPILHDFKPDSVHHLVTHSDSKLLFCDAEIWEKLDPGQMPGLKASMMIADFSLLMSHSDKISKAAAKFNELFGKKYPNRFSKEDVTFHIDKPDELAVINYTSGSTGFSKGVMLPYRALHSNLQYCIDHLSFLHPGDGIVCMLPMAHMYGLMVDLIHCFTKGCHLHFLTRLPSPSIILKAFASVRPKLIVTVPLILEKIIKNKVFPLLDKPVMKVLLKMPIVDNKLLQKIRDKIIDTFGGNVLQIIIGGASLSRDVEQFLRRIKFPFTVGYGMTECAPLIAYAPWEVQKPASCGCLVDRMQARIDSPNPARKPGVLWVKGDNVMAGYYKNDEATKEAFDADGWMNTGDICTMDADGYLYIRGRDKTMILGPSGQNIYPEEIEQVLANLPYVSECLVVSNTDNQLEALVYPDYETAEKQGMSRDELNNIMQQNLKLLNEEMPAYSKVSAIKVMKEEFEKTPKRSIKRYLYQK